MSLSEPVLQGRTVTLTLPKKNGKVPVPKLSVKEGNFLSWRRALKRFFKDAELKLDNADDAVYHVW